MKGGREADKDKNKDKNQDAAREKITASAGDGSIELPTQLLTTNGTAGAAELFAAALSGNKRGELVGERTLGRTVIDTRTHAPEPPNAHVAFSADAPRFVGLLKETFAR